MKGHKVYVQLGSKPFLQWYFIHHAAIVLLDSRLYITLCLVIEETEGKKIQDLESYTFKKKKLFEGEWERISNNKDLRFELLFSILSMSKQKKAVILNLCRFCITNDAWIQIIVVCKVVLM